MSLVSLLKTSDPAYRRNLWFFLISYFLVLFNYPLIRAASTTLFFEAFGARSSPAAILWSVVFLSLSIYLCNRLQKKLAVQNVLLIVSAVSTFLFGVSALGFVTGSKALAYLAFVWKEIYIVLQVHLLLAYANNFFRKEDFRLLVGPVGAAGSLGGILGGLVTSAISTHYGTINVLWLALVFVLAPAVVFLFTQHLRSEVSEKKSPLSSLNTRSVREYVFCIAAIVALTQFFINILDFRFNLAFEASVVDSGARTGYLGKIYTYTNLVTFFLQVFLVPFLLPRVSEKNYHLFIPVSYLVCVGFLSWGFQMNLFSVALIYVYVKAADYSLFSSGKEILYQPLGPEQKYGAKYLTDMLVYRSSKALIAAVLIYLQSSFILNVLMASLLLLWLIMVIRLFQLHPKH